MSDFAALERIAAAYCNIPNICEAFEEILLYVEPQHAEHSEAAIGTNGAAAPVVLTIEHDMGETEDEQSADAAD